MRLSNLGGISLFCAILVAFSARTAKAFSITCTWQQQSTGFSASSPPASADVEQFLADAFPLFGLDASAAAVNGHISSVSAVRLAPFQLNGKNRIGLSFDFTYTGDADITTAGYIDKQLAKQQKHAEFAQVDVDKEVWRQDFGQMKADRRSELLLPSLTGPVDMTVTFADDFISLPPGFVAGAGGLTPPLNMTFAVVPEPASISVLLLGTCLLFRRRF